MAYAYTNTVPGLLGTIRQLRSAFPSPVTADTLKKWGIAPNNETYVIHVLRFLGILDDEGKKIPDAAKVFVIHDDAEFAGAFEPLVRSAYAGLFSHFGEDAWTLPKERLIGFFRAEDQTSAAVGVRQAGTFQALAGLAGHAPAAQEARSTGSSRKKAPTEKAGKRAVARAEGRPSAQRGTPKSDTTGWKAPSTRIMDGLAVRIEINLPVTDDQDVYDKIFRSLRANLIDA